MKRCSGTKKYRDGSERSCTEYIKDHLASCPGCRQSANVSHGQAFPQINLTRGEPMPYRSPRREL